MPDKKILELYGEVVEEELAVMDAQLDEPPKSTSPPEIHIPLRFLIRPAITIEIGASTQEAINLMIANDVDYVLVVSDGVLKGIFSERDALLKILSKPAGDLTQIPVEHFISADPQTLGDDDLLDTAILHMEQNGYRHIPIVDDQNRPVGVVSVQGIISHFVECLSQKRSMLLPKTTLEPMQAREGA